MAKRITLREAMADCRRLQDEVESLRRQLALQEKIDKHHIKQSLAERDLLRGIIDMLVGSRHRMARLHVLNKISELTHQQVVVDNNQ